METGMEKLAIIGAGYIGRIIAEEARKMRVETHCFAWEKGAVAKDSVDHFYPVSVTEKEKILDICREIGIDGVVAAASVSITTAAYVAEQMGLNGNPPDIAAEIADKYRNRRLTREIPELEPVGFRLVRCREDVQGMNYPLILKPVSAGGKAGLSVVESGEQLEDAFRYGEESHYREFIAEEYIGGGREYSVESLTYHGKNYILQVTAKVSGGPPHCVELAHHQPADLSPEMREKVERVTDRILVALGVRNGPCHTEIKIVDGRIYLIEVNGRMAGGHVSHPLVELSTGYPYVQGVIEVALDRFRGIDRDKLLHRYASVFFVTQQTAYLKPVFDTCEQYDWCWHKQETSRDLILYTHNDGYRINYFIYYSEKEPPRFARY